MGQLPDTAHIVELFSVLALSQQAPGLIMDEVVDHVTFVGTLEGCITLFARGQADGSEQRFAHLCLDTAESLRYSVVG